MILECSKEEILQIIAKNPHIERDGLYYDWICYIFYKGKLDCYTDYSRKNAEICADNSYKIWKEDDENAPL